jgi:hypothetical protein|tara:strand:- start:39 stop:344 length:306 start_codon:yes stop_codon:yes gene_type:complete
MSIFGVSVGFSSLSEASAMWLGICDEVEEVQYMDGGRGRGRKRRRITMTVKHFIARSKRYEALAPDEQKAEWTKLLDDAEKQYAAMLKTKEVLNQELDNVW